MLYEQATYRRLQASWPLYRVAQLLANEGGGRIDDSDPLAKPYLAKAEARRKKDREPRKIPFEVTDFIMPWESYSPLLNDFKQATAGDDTNPYERVPLAVLQEMRADLDAGRLPGWFYSSLPSIPKLKALTESLEDNVHTS